MENAVVANEVIQEKDEIVKLASMAVTDRESFDRAGALMLHIKDLKKKIEASYGPIIDAAHKAHKAALAAQKEYLSPLESAEAALKKATAAWWAGEEAKRKAAEQKAREEAEAKRKEEEALNAALGLEDTVPTVADAPISAPADKGGIKFRDVWKFEIENEAALPRDYMEVARALKDQAQIPGVRVYCEKTSYA